MSKSATISVSKLKVRKGDRVRLIAGNDRGKEGAILRIYPAKQQAVVEGCRMVKRHLKPDANHPNGRIDSREAPIHISNLVLLDPKKKEPTRVGRKRNTEGKLQRYAKKTGEFIVSAAS